MTQEIKTIITPSLYEFCNLLQEAFEDGWRIDANGATIWGICYEVQVVKGSDAVVQAAVVVPELVQPVKKQMGRPKNS